MNILHLSQPNHISLTFCLCACLFIVNVSSTANVIWRRVHGLESHPTYRRNWGRTCDPWFTRRVICPLLTFFFCCFQLNRISSEMKISLLSVVFTVYLILVAKDNVGVEAVTFSVISRYLKCCASKGCKDEQYCIMTNPGGRTCKCVYAYDMFKQKLWHHYMVLTANVQVINTDRRGFTLSKPTTLNFSQQAHNLLSTSIRRHDVDTTLFRRHVSALCMCLASHVVIWTSVWEKADFVACEQQRRRPACACAQSSQCLCNSLPVKYSRCHCFMQNFNILNSMCSWVGWFEPQPRRRFSPKNRNCFKCLSMF